MYSNYQYQDDILRQLHFIFTDPEYRWKTATCILSLVVILSWLLGRWRQEDEICSDPDSDLLRYMSSQINTLNTDRDELLKEIPANIVNCTTRKKVHKYDAYSSQSEDSDLSDVFSHNRILWKTLNWPTQKSGRDQMFLQQSYDSTSSESEEMSHKSGLGLCVSDYSTSTISTNNSPSSSLCPTSSDSSMSDEMSESDHSSLTTISTVTTASSKRGLKVSRQRQLWKRAILFVRIVVMLLPQRLKQKKGIPFQEWKGKGNMTCSDKSVISDDSPLDSTNSSFHHKRAMFEKYFKIAKNSQNPLMPNQSPPVGRAQTDLKKENEENIMAVTADGPSVLACLGEEATDALERSLKRNMGNAHLQNMVSLTCHSQDSYDNGSPPLSSPELCKALESEITPFHSRHCHGDETKKNVTARRQHFCVFADQHHEKKDQTSFWDVKPVTMAANYQSLRLKTDNIKGNSSQEDSQKPNCPVKGRGTYQDMVDGIITLGDIGVELTDKQKCQEITLSQQQIPSGSGLNSSLKSASEPDLCSLSSSKAKAQGGDKVAFDLISLNLRQKYWERRMKTPTLYHKSLQMLSTNGHDQSLSRKHLDKETPSLEEARSLTFKKGITNKLEFNIKQKVLYQLLGLPLVVQRSLDTTMTTPNVVKDLNPSEEGTSRKPRQERTSLQKWNFPKRVVKSLKTFEMPKGMSLKNLSLGNDKKNKKPKIPLSNDTNQGPAIQASCKRSDINTETGNTGHSSRT